MADAPLAPGQTQAQQLRAGGFSDSDVASWAQQKRQTLTDGGFSDSEINGWFGQPDYDFDKMQGQVKANLAVSPKPVTDFESALEAGWQQSVTGLVSRGKAPEMAVSPDAPIMSRLAGMAAGITGDLPAMIAGFAGGTGAGVETGPGAPIVGTATAFALPQLLRSTLMDAYTKGSFTNFADFWPRAAGIIADTAKAYVTGGATAIAGAGVGAAVAPVASAGITKLAQTAAEAATMTTVGKALQGQVPSAQDFLDSAVAVGGLHFAGAGAAKLRDIYSQTGIKPADVVADTRQDVTIQQDLASNIIPIPTEYLGLTKSTTEGYHPDELGLLKMQDQAVNDEGEWEYGNAPQMPIGGGEPPEPPEPPITTTPSSGDPQKAILDHLSIGEQSSGRPWTFSRLYSAAVDRLFPLSKVGPDEPASEDPYKLARLMAGAPGKADAMLTGEGTYDFNTYKNNGPSLESVLDPVKDDLDGFRAYAASRRALELEGRDVKTGFDLGAAQAVVDEGAAKYEQHLQNLIGFQNNVAAYLRDSGVLSQDGYDAMLEANKFYVPFQRLIEPEPGLRISNVSLQAKNPIHAIEGSERTVIDPIESVIRNTYLFTQMAERNAVGTKLVDLLSKEAEQSENPAPIDEAKTALTDSGVTNPDALEPMLSSEMNPARPGEIRIYRDGKPETYRIDPELAIAMKGLDQQSMGMIERALAPLSRTLRAGAVLQPDFMLRHTLRDYLYAFVTTGEGLFSPMDMVRGVVGLARKDEDFENWRKAGGANISMVSLDRRYLQTSIDDLAGTGLLERAWNVVGNPEAGIGEKAKAVATLPIKAAQKFLISPLQVGVQFAENASHLGAFKKSIRRLAPEGEPTKEQIQQAGFVSRDTAVDASRMGSAMRPWNAISAFANITVQDTDRVLRAFATSPMATAIKVAGAISVPSALVWLNGKDDSRYKDAPDWEKDLFWVIPTDKWEDADPNNVGDLPTDLVRSLSDGRTQINNGTTWRVPKPWGMGIVFGSGVERTLDAYAAHNPDAFSGFASSMGQVSIPNLLPNAITPSIEQFANRSLFTNRTLISSPQEGWLPEYQYTPYTSELAKALGGVIGAFPGISDLKTQSGLYGGGVARALSSPILIENYVRAWSGNLGMYALQAADAGLRKAGVIPDPPHPNDTLADVPFVRAFVVRYPDAGSQPMQDFYDAFERNQTYYNTWIGLARAGDSDAAARVMQAGGESMMVQLTGIKDVIAEQAKLVRDIYANPDIPSDEKRQLIDTTYWRMTELAKAGNQALRSIPAAKAGAP